MRRKYPRESKWSKSQALHIFAFPGTRLPEPKVTELNEWSIRIRNSRYVERNYGPPFDTSIADAGAKIVINDADGTAIAVIEASGASGTGDYWYACDIDGTGIITEIDQLTESPP